MDEEYSLTDEEYWSEGYYGGFEPKVITKVGYYELYDKYLSPDPSKTVLEIGCGGGRHLCYLARNYQYRPFGVDFSKVGLECTRKTFGANGMDPPELFHADLFEWNPGRRFDVVCSHGFVEHFENFGLALKKHSDLVEPGGTLIFSMPHMAHLNYVFRWLVDRDSLKHHNTRIMNLRAIRKAIAPLPLEILHLNYYRTFAFLPPRSDLKPWQKVAYKLIYAFGRRVRKTVGRKRPNFLISPKIICFARRLET